MKGAWMAILDSGTYVPNHERKVTVWPKADAHGDGEDVFEDQYDGDGNFLRRDQVLDNNGNPVREYLPPPGFVNVPTKSPGADGVADNYVRANNRGGVFRNKNGHAIGIRPGTALVEYSDGTHELLKDDWAMKQFADAHQQLDSHGMTVRGE